MDFLIIMKITSLIDNTSQSGLPVEHGLSLYIERHDALRVLFDMGQRALFAENAVQMNLSISHVDVAIISHGHYDHGGGLKRFLELNSHAKVYIHKQAFEPHYSLKENGLRFIGLEESLTREGQIVMCDDLTTVDSHMTLFANVQGSCCQPAGNKRLFKANSPAISPYRHTLSACHTIPDDFHHEQNLLIKENGNTILLAGCAHRGIVNIMRKAQQILGYAPTHVLAGMHLAKSGWEEQEEDAFIAELAQHLMQYRDTQFYTMHCTGVPQFEKLHAIMGEQMKYLSCGESVTIHNT